MYKNKHLRLEDNGDDTELWNNAYLELKDKVGEAHCTWFKGSWLFSECYLYRRIRECMLLNTSQMRHYDPFELAKVETHELSRLSISSLIRSLCPLDYVQVESMNLDVQRERFRVIVEVRFIFS